MFYVQYRNGTGGQWLPLTCDSAEYGAIAAADRAKNNYSHVRVVDSSGMLVYMP